MKKRILPLILSLILLVSACGKDAGQITPTPTAPTQTPDITPTSPPSDIQFTNPLTGLPIDEAWVNARPVAVMLNNIKIALPQQGNSQADIIFEVLAEGGITRMLAVYQSMAGVGAIGSVRSSRPYYLELALGLDAIYMHAGGSDDAYAKIKQWQVTALDCVRSTAYSNVFWRDQTRIKNNGYEHSVLTSGDAIVEHFPSYDFRKTHNDDYQSPFTFTPDGTPVGGTLAQVITVPFSNVKTGVFTYNADTKKYAVEEYGKPYIDGNNQAQVAVTNVVALYTNCKVIDDYGRMSVALGGGSGSGLFACGGQSIPILWSKESHSAPLVLTLEDGSPLPMGQGNSYINIVPLTAAVTAQ